MTTYRLTRIATLVSAALSVTTATAAPSISNDLLISPTNFDQAGISKRLFSADAVAQQKLAKRQTKSGMLSHYDSKLAKATFVWGGHEQVKPNMNLVLPENRTHYASNYYLNQLTGFSVDSNNEGNKAVLAFTHDLNRGAIVTKYRQQVQGIEVFNKEYNVMMDREHNLVASSGYFTNKTPAAKIIGLLASFGSAEFAIQAAIADLSKKQANVQLTKVKDSSGYQVFQADNVYSGPQVIGEPRAKKVFYDLNGSIVAAYYIEISLAKLNSLDSIDHSYVINAQNGKVLFRNNLVAQDQHNDFTYRVYASEDGYPWEGPHGNVIPALVQGEDTTVVMDAPLVTLPFFSKISTSDAWLSDDAVITSGNNVFAYADVLAPQGFTDGDYTAETTAEKTFDYQFDSGERASNLNNGKAAIVNLFFMNNFLHDWWYDHGFDESSGNAQLLNYNRGGVEGDPLEVQAQDYSGLNNANMLTPADGASPRMQQYLYNSKDAINGVDQGITITSHVELGLLSSLQLSSFGPAQYDLFSGDIVRLNDGNVTDSSSDTDGCEAAVNSADLAGKIAIIDRGSCNFTAKVLNAQNAGAIAAIIVNNTNDGSPAPMGGADANVTIPNVGLNYAEGHAIYELVDADDTVTAAIFSNFPLKDSSFDNGIIAHEWGHYIQNRLVGNANGLINFQGRAMGEGWSDFHSMMFIVKSGDTGIDGNTEFQVPYATGTYVEDFFTGIRRVPYSPNFDFNPLMFRHIEEGTGADVGLPPTSVASPHAAGEIWGTVLWDVYVRLLNTHEFSEAQGRMADYLVAGYKLTPISPTYTEARDALLASMYANDPDDFQLALEAFARRGMGLGAVSPARTSTNNTGVVESTETQLASFEGTNITINTAFDGVDVGYCSNDSILDVGETATVTVSIRNIGSEALTGVPAQLKVSGDHDVTIENDGWITFDDVDLFAEVVSVPLQVTLNDAAVADMLEFEVEFPEQAEGDTIQEPSSFKVTTQVNMDFEARATEGNTSTDNMESVTLFNDWKLNVMAGGDQAEETRSIDSGNTAFFNELNPGVDLGAQTMFLANNPFTADVAVETQPIEVGFGANFSMSFWHFYWLEQNYDGGVIEASINGSDWTDVTEVGGVFDFGYTGELASEIPGRVTFTGINGDLATSAGNVETINFGSALNGQTVRFRFRVVSDAGVADFGWNIDNVTFTNISSPAFSNLVAGNTFACDNSAPKLTLSDSDITLNENTAGTVTVAVTDRNSDDVHTYVWTQTDGPTAALSGIDTETLTFTPADVTSATSLTFQVAVNDGNESVTSSVNVTVNDVTPAPTPTPAKKSSSGSSMPWYTVLLLPLVWLRRRRS